MVKTKSLNVRLVPIADFQSESEGLIKGRFYETYLPFPFGIAGKFHKLVSIIILMFYPIMIIYEACLCQYLCTRRTLIYHGDSKITGPFQCHLLSVY